MELSPKLKQIEENLDLEDLRARGKWIYPIIKQHIISPFIRKEYRLKTSEESPQNHKFRFGSFYESAKWWLKNPRLGKYDILIVESSVTRRKRDDGLYCTIYSDFLPEIFTGDSCIMIENPAATFPYHRLPALTKNIYYSDMHIIKALALSKFRKISLEGGHATLRKIFEEIGIQVPVSVVDGYITRFFRFRRFYLELLQKTDPELVFLVSSYSYNKMALVDACQELRIPSIELQHGYIFQNHIGYIYKQVHSRDLFPDYLLSFGDHFSRIIRSESRMFLSDRIISTGFRHLENIRNNPVGIKQNIIPSSENKKIILVSSQWTVNSFLRRFVLDVADILPEQFTIIYKTHPAEINNTEFYKDFSHKPNICLIDDPTVDILELLKIADVHSTVYSTSHFEASFFGVPNIFIHIDRFALHIDEHLKSRSNFLVNTPEQFISKVQEIITNYEYISHNAVAFSEQFYRANATENIKNAVAKIKKVKEGTQP